jgi:hypothetical protein
MAFCDIKGKIMGHHPVTFWLKLQVPLYISLNLNQKQLKWIRSAISNRNQTFASLQLHWSIFISSYLLAHSSKSNLTHKACHSFVLKLAQYELHKSFLLVCVCICVPLIVARQPLGEHLTAAMNTHNRIVWWAKVTLRPTVSRPVS